MLKMGPWMHHHGSKAKHIFAKQKHKLWNLGWKGLRSMTFL